MGVVGVHQGHKVHLGAVGVAHDAAEAQPFKDVDAGERDGGIASAERGAGAVAAVGDDDIVHGEAYAVVRSASPSISGGLDI